MQCASNTVMSLDYERLPRCRDLAPWGILGCRVMAACLLLLAQGLLMWIVELLIASEYRLALMAMTVSLMAGWGCMIFWQAATDIVEDFRCHLLPAIYYLILLVLCLLGCGISLTMQAADAGDLPMEALFCYAILFLVPLLILTALLGVLVIIMKRWKTRNHPVHA